MLAPLGERRNARLRGPLAALALAYVVLGALAPASGEPNDLGYWASWICDFRHLGLGRIYEARLLDYPPLWPYLLSALTPCFPADYAGTYAAVHHLKWVPLLFDLGTCALLMAMLARGVGHPGRAFFVALNVAYLYDSLLWGQIDGMYAFLVFAALLAALGGRASLCAVLLVVAFNVKLQTIAFAPIVLLVCARRLGGNQRAELAALAWAALTQALILLPLALAGQLPRWLQLVVGASGHTPVASADACNIWQLLLPGEDPKGVPDDRSMLGLPLKVWGALLYGVNIGWLSIASWRRAGHLEADGARATAALFLITGLAGIAFFAFPTEMHERYACASLAFLGAYAALSGKPLVYAVASIGIFLNLEAHAHLIAVLTPAAWLFRRGPIAVVILAAYGLGVRELMRTRQARTVGASPATGAPPIGAGTPCQDRERP